MALMAMVVQWGYQYSRQKMTLDESSGRKNKTENRLFLPQSIKNYVTKSQKNLTDVTYYHQTETHQIECQCSTKRIYAYKTLDTKEIVSHLKKTKGFVTNVTAHPGLEDNYLYDGVINETL